jgi:hypothetical protein
LDKPLSGYRAAEPGAAPDRRGTLHHYDETGLLKPSLHTEAGYRLYTRGDIARLQQVLRQIGFALGHTCKKWAMIDRQFNPALTYRHPSAAAARLPNPGCQRQKFQLPSCRPDSPVTKIPPTVAVATVGGI